MYELEYNPDPFDLTKMVLKGIYSSIHGVINFIFTISIIFLMIRFWSSVGIGLKTLMFISLLLFPLIQPLFIHLNSIRTFEDLDKDLVLIFDDYGITSKSKKTDEFIEWKDIVGIAKSNDTYVVYTQGSRGYILSSAQYRSIPGLKELLEEKR